MSSNASSHSRVSVGSTSGNWWLTPSKSTTSMVPPVSYPFRVIGQPGWRPARWSDRWFRPSPDPGSAAAAAADRACCPVDPDAATGPPPRSDGRLHGRLVPGQPRSRWLGVGGARRPAGQRRRAPDHQPAHGGHRRGPRPRGPSSGPVHVISDSTYVVNCFRQRWWEGWLRRGWRNSQRQAGGQSRPVGDAARPGPGRRASGHLRTG